MVCVSSISSLAQSKFCLGNLIAPEISKHIDPLPPIDHSEIAYAPFEKNFYAEHEEIRNLSNNQVNELRQKLGVNVIGKIFRWYSIKYWFQVRGVNIPRPIVSFAHFGFDERLMKTLRKSEFATPTPIQSQVENSFHTKGLFSMSISRLYPVHWVDEISLGLPRLVVEKQEHSFGQLLFISWLK